jgi:hypothetical protein
MDKKILNIVNGDNVLNHLRESGIIGGFLAWGDFLHEGPVPEALDLEELSKVRANFISKKGLGSFEDIYKEFQQRDEVIKGFKEYDEIYLWFENDLYDQLQLIQILDYFAKNNPKNNIYIINPTNYLSQSSPQELYDFLSYNQELVTHNHFITAQKTWSSFRHYNPYILYKILKDDTQTLPFLKDSIKRILQEYPNTFNGLSKTQYQALISISNDNNNPNDIYIDCQKKEKRPFMGEIIFFYMLKELVEGNLILSLQDGHYMELTQLGKDVLEGKENWLNIKKIDKWIGGVHLSSRNLWYWDIESKIITNIDINKKEE